MWIFRAATGYCHWCNQATAELFGPEPFDNFDWGPYCRDGLQGEMKVWPFLHAQKLSAAAHLKLAKAVARGEAWIC